MLRPSAKAHRRSRGSLARRLAALAAFAAGSLVATPARAASLSAAIAGYTTANVPGYISMFEYVPAKLQAKPPILVVSHFCSGSAAAVFGEAQGGGIVAAADQLGFLMIFPQTTNNCWDVGSAKALTRDGGGDTQAIAEMVKYEIAKRGADPNRVYATGTSSGAMMTEALLAIYPDVFKAGAEFSGVPAGCWSASYDPTIQWSGPCAGGTVTMSAAQWGNLVRAINPGYSGYRPRVQLWHGTADATISYNNQGEAIKEWTNVLGLGANPTSTTTVTLNAHQWTRQSWQDSCGFTVLDAWSEQNGPHGTDANLNAANVIPFLGLDKTGPDPEVAACGDAGASASSSGGGNGSSGGTGDAGRDAAAGSSSGSSGGGRSSSGAGSSSGSGAGSASSSSGSSGTSSGSTSSGGQGSSGSGSSSGGSTSSGSSSSSSGSTNGGSTSSGSSGGTGSSEADGGTSVGATGPGSPSSGCACALVGRGQAGTLGWVALLGVGLLASRRRRTPR